MWSITINSLLPSPNLPPALLNQTDPAPPHLIFAGAGTGKTTTITVRIAGIVEKEGIDSSRILALTLSKEGARNLCETAEKLL